MCQFSSQVEHNKVKAAQSKTQFENYFLLLLEKEMLHGNEKVLRSLIQYRKTHFPYRS